MYNKASIDKDAEREAKALRKQGCSANHNAKRTRLQHEYNRREFDKLFKGR